MFNLRLTTIFISALLLSCSPEPVSLEVSPEPAAVSGLNGLVDETQRFNDWLDEEFPYDFGDEESKITASLPDFQTILQRFIFKFT